MNEKLIKQLEQIQQWLSQKNNDLNGFIDWDSTNPNVIADPEWARLTKIQEDLLAIDQRIVQVSNKKGLGFKSLKLDQKTAPIGTTALPPAAKGQEIAPSETTLEPPNPLEMLASNDETMGLVEEGEDNGDPGIINIGNIESIKSESGVDSIIAVLGVTPHETNAPAYLVDAINTFIASMRLSATTGSIALIAANTKSWKNSDYRMLVALNGRDLSLGTPFKSELWKDCEQSIGKKTKQAIVFDFEENIQILSSADHMHKINIFSNDGRYNKICNLKKEDIENYHMHFVQSEVFMDKERFSEKIIGTKVYHIDSTPNRKYFVTIFDGNGKIVLNKSELPEISLWQKFQFRIIKSMNFIKTPSIAEALDEQLVSIIGNKENPNEVNKNITKMHSIGFGISLKAGKEITHGGNGINFYKIETREGMATKVGVNIQETTVIFSFQPSLWVNAVSGVGDVYISSITYDFNSKNINIERSKNWLTGSTIDTYFKQFFLQVFNDINIDDIFNEHELPEKIAKIQGNVIKYMGGGSGGSRQNDANIVAEGILFNGSISIKENVSISIGSWGGIILKSGAVVGANIDLAASIDKIIESPEQTKINELSIDTSDMYLVNEKGGVEAIFKGIAVKYGGEVSVDILIQNKAYKKIKLYEAIVKAAGEMLFKRAMTTGKPLVLPNGSPITKSAEFVQAAMETEILDGISRFAIEQILRNLLIQNVKAANPSFTQYGIDIEKALGL